MIFDLPPNIIIPSVPAIIRTAEDIKPPSMEELVARSQYEQGIIPFNIIRASGPPSFHASTVANTTTTARQVSIPANSTGKLAVSLFTMRGGLGATLTFPGDWNQFQPAISVNNIRCAGAWKVLDGSEGSTVALTSSNVNSLACTSTTAVFSNVNNAAFGTSVTGNNAAPNSPSLTPSAGTRNYMFLSFFFWDGTASTISSGPSGYTVTSPVDERAAQSYKLVLNSSAADDPGTWSMSQARDWRANTGVLWRA